MGYTGYMGHLDTGCARSMTGGGYDFHNEISEHHESLFEMSLRARVSEQSNLSLDGLAAFWM